MGSLWVQVADTKPTEYYVGQKYRSKDKIWEMDYGRLYPTQYSLYSMHYTLLHNTHYTPYAIHIHYPLYILYIIHYSLYTTIHYSLYTVHHSPYTVHYTVYTTPSVHTILTQSSCQVLGGLTLKGVGKGRDKSKALTCSSA